MVRIFILSLERKRTCSLETEQTLNLPRLFRVANSEGKLFFKCVITQATSRLLVENILRDSHSLFWSFCVLFVVLVALRFASIIFSLFEILGCYSSCKDSVSFLFRNGESDTNEERKKRMQGVVPSQCF